MKLNIKLVIAFIYLFVSLSLSNKATDTIPSIQDSTKASNPLLTIQPKNQSSWSKLKDLFL